MEHIADFTDNLPIEITIIGVFVFLDNLNNEIILNQLLFLKVIIFIFLSRGNWGFPAVFFSE